ncbi:unnamed protein product [Pieris brassicae]|uniref:Uncharacterized protein n=1 Tax=Pieris brassicae TaxID=7116 RepID=A0A9P0TFJ4_PIEBR|nr:unnamed protein product [Pieris brassicae]
MFDCPTVLVSTTNIISKIEIQKFVFIYNSNAFLPVCHINILEDLQQPNSTRRTENSKTSKPEFWGFPANFAQRRPQSEGGGYQGGLGTRGATGEVTVNFGWLV